MRAFSVKVKHCHQCLKPGREKTKSRSKQSVFAIGKGLTGIYIGPGFVLNILILGKRYEQNNNLGQAKLKKTEDYQD